MSLLLIWQQQSGSGPISANAETATVTVAANSAADAVAPTTSVAAVTLAANSATPKVAPTAGTAPVVLVANTAAETDSPTATGAALTLAANAPAASVAASAGSAAVTVAALDATATGTADGTATATGAGIIVTIPGAFDLGGFDHDAFDIPAHVVAVDGGVAPVVTPPRRHGGKPLNAATITGPTGRRVRHVRARAQLATVTVRAYDATTHWNDDDFAILLLLEAA